MTDWRSLCAELVSDLQEARDAVDEWADGTSDYFKQKHDLQGELNRIQQQIDRARAKLAQPEPEEQMSVSKIAQILLAHSSAEPIMGMDRIIYQTEIMPIANEICERFAKPEETL